jgi:DNA polymerase III alpha subunit
MIIVSGCVDKRDGRDEVSILASDIIPLSQARHRYVKKLAISLQSDTLSPENINRIKMLLEGAPGSCSVYMSVQKEGNGETLVKSKKFCVEPSPNLIKDLRQVVGKENVWIEG